MKVCRNNKNKRAHKHIHIYTHVHKWAGYNLNKIKPKLKTAMR